MHKVVLEAPKTVRVAAAATPAPVAGKLWFGCAPPVSAGLILLRTVAPRRW